MKIQNIKIVEYEPNDVVVFTRDTDYGFYEGDIGLVESKNKHSDGWKVKTKPRMGCKYANLIGHDIKYIGRFN